MVTVTMCQDDHVQITAVEGGTDVADHRIRPQTRSCIHQDIAIPLQKEDVGIERYRCVNPLDGHGKMEGPGV